MSNTSESGDTPLYRPADDDSVSENISKSIELISRLEYTAKASSRILQQASVFYETNKMVESSKVMNRFTRMQLRRSLK